MKPRFALIGEHPVLSSDLERRLSRHGFVWVLGQHNVHGDWLDEVKFCLEELKPDAVIYLATLQEQPQWGVGRDFAMTVNCQVPAEIARWCRQERAVHLHLSSRAVYSPEAQIHREDDAPDPCDWLGQVSLTGEEEVLSAAAPSLIFRASEIVNASFLAQTVHDHRRGLLDDDELVAPLWSEDAADFLESAICTALSARGDAHPGYWGSINHLSAQGFTSALGMAEVTARATTFLAPVTGARIRQVRGRLLDCSQTEQRWGRTMPEWQDSLTRCLTQ